MSSVVQLRSKGTLTLPVELRRKYSLQDGDVYTLIDLGDGAFLLSPHLTQVDRYGDQLAEKMTQANLSVNDMLDALEEERQQYYRQHYVQD